MGQENREILELKCFSSVISMSTFKCTAKLFFKTSMKICKQVLHFTRKGCFSFINHLKMFWHTGDFFLNIFFILADPQTRLFPTKVSVLQTVISQHRQKKYPENSQSDLLLPDWLSTDASTSQLNFSNYCMYLNMFHFLGNLCCNMGYTSFL